MGKQNRVKRHRANVGQFWQKFSPEELAAVCVMPEADFAEKYDMQTVVIPERGDYDNFYHFKDNGSKILAVAHLDTVIEDDRRAASFVNTEAGWVVFSGALDDRLGAYTILELLPKLGMQFDILLTVGEESGRSTAEFFEPEKDYDWIIEFDRGGTDVVMYQYHDDDTAALVQGSGARVARGSFSDIAYLEHLGRKAFNWGIGYEDYHGPRGHAFLEDTAKMVAHFMEFHRNNAGAQLPHVKRPALPVAAVGWSGGSYSPRIGSPRIGGLYGYGSDSWEWDDDPTVGELLAEVDEAEAAEIEAELEAEDQGEADFHAWLLRKEGERCRVDQLPQL